MAVHYKFRSTIEINTITFNGLHISVGDLKEAILQQKRLSKNGDFDLQISDAQTKEKYTENACLIPKNTSLIVARVPLEHQSKKAWAQKPEKAALPPITNKAEVVFVDISKMKGSEDEKIEAMMLQSTADYDPKNYPRIYGQSQNGEVYATYRCNKCKKGGHWIKNCPFIVEKEFKTIKRHTGIPKSFRDNNDHVQKKEVQKPMPSVEKKQQMPADLLCSICNNLFTDAVIIPCCGFSFCDGCVRTALLESKGNECPNCKEKENSPEFLFPNRFLRNSVNAFKNTSDYKDMNLEQVLQNGEPALVLNTPNEADTYKMAEKSPENDDIGSLPKPSGIEISSNNLQIYSHSNSPRATHRPKRVRDCAHDKKERDYPEPPYKKHHSLNLHTMPTQPLSNELQRNTQYRPINSHEMYSGSGQILNICQHVPMHPQIPQDQPMPIYDNMCTEVGHITGNGYPHYVRLDFHNSMRVDTRQTISDGILASVAAKVGTGIIDDPLEAFNRIMIENEKRKEEHRYSQSTEKFDRRFRTSSYNQGITREPSQEKQVRSRKNEIRWERNYNNKHVHKKAFRPRH